MVTRMYISGNTIPAPSIGVAHMPPATPAPVQGATSCIGGEPDERFQHKLPEDFPFRLLAFFAAKGLPWMVVGSRAICDPIPPGADTDILVYNPYAQGHWFSKWRYKKEAREIPETLQKLGFRQQGGYDSPHLGSNLNVWYNREIDCHLIMATKQDAFRLFRDATLFAARLNIRSKYDRIKLFNIMGVCK